MSTDTRTEVCRLVDYVASNGATDYDVARLVAAQDSIRAKHRYADKGWEYFDTDSNEWKEDTKASHIGHTVMYTVSVACNERALYWQNKVMQGQSTDPYFDELRVLALMELTLKFKEKKFLRNVVNECKALLSVD